MKTFLLVLRSSVFAGATSEDGLPGPCVLKPEWIRIVERAYLGPWIATFPETRLSESEQPR